MGVPKDDRRRFPLLRKGRDANFCATVKLIFTILLSYPLAGVLKRLPDTEPAKKNIFMIGYDHPPLAQLQVRGAMDRTCRVY